MMVEEWIDWKHVKMLLIQKNHVIYAFSLKSGHMGREFSELSSNSGRVYKAHKYICHENISSTPRYRFKSLGEVKLWI